MYLVKAMMFNLLFILFVTKLYAHINIYKENVIIMYLSFVLDIVLGESFSLIWDNNLVFHTG